MSQTAQATQAIEAVKPNAIDLVTEEFIAAIRKDGIAHTFEWMSHWFERVGRASVEVEMNTYLGDDFRANRDAQNLYLLERMAQMSESVTNQSSLESSNMMRRARLAAMAHIFRGNRGAFASSKMCEAEWEKITAANNAKKAEKAEKAHG